MAIDLDTFTDHGRLVHMVHTRQFSRSLIEEIFDIADSARRLNGSRQGSRYLQDTLVGSRALLFFAQPSSRTFLSFHAAASALGMSVAEVRDRETSSEMKGESLLDTVRTYGAYHDLIVMRYPEAGFSELCARHFIEYDLRRHIINGGSGQDDHPTQALLDIYTLHREFYNRGGVDGKRILLVGDLKRGRAARSLMHLLTLFDDVSVDLVSPPSLKMKDDLIGLGEKRLAEIRTGAKIETFLPTADAVYMTRVQSEYNTPGNVNEVDTSAYALSSDRYSMMRADAIVMHPLPRREEIPAELDRDRRSRYWAQAENGMWARSGLIAHMLRRGEYLRSA